MLPLSSSQNEGNTARAWQRGLGQRVNTELKNWKVLRKICSCLTQDADLASAIRAVMIANT